MLKFLHHKQQATRRQKRLARRLLSSRRFLRFSYMILIFSLVLWSWKILQNPETLPIESVQIQGSFSFTDPEQIKKAIMPYLNAGFFNINVQEIKSQLLMLSWVEAVDVTRVWPHRLKIRITEQQPIAEWDHKALINEQGNLFFPPLSSFPQGLADLSGPDNAEKTALDLFLKFNDALAKLNLSVAKVEISADQAINLSLNNGMLVKLGRQNNLERLQRFVAAYPRVFVGKANQVEYVDMRYTNGMAVLWKKA